MENAASSRVSADPFTALVRKYQKSIKRQVLGLSYSPHYHNDADDMTQKVLLRLWRNRDYLPKNESQLRLYIKRAVNSVVVDESRQRHRKNERLIEVSHERARELSDEKFFDREFREAETVAIVERATIGIPDEQLETLLLFADGWKTREIAEFQNVPHETTRTRLFYARRRARANLEKNSNETFGIAGGIVGADCAAGAGEVAEGTGVGGST